LACDGLYSATDAEQWGLHDPKLMTLLACHCASGATPPADLHGAAPDQLPHDINHSTPLAV
jgi:hypothetical protein